jgi:hypothetical protein
MGAIASSARSVVTQARFPDPGENLSRVPEQVGRPLINLAAHEPVEILEADADRPLVERSGGADSLACRDSSRTDVLPQSRCLGR